MVNVCVVRVLIMWRDGGRGLRLVECIPNISEGRRPGLVDGIAEALRAASDVRLLHVHTDVDHNRSVFTAVGEPQALVQALEAMYGRALEAIDMRRQQGAHPRIGAVDVCPFVPLPEYGTDMQDCVRLARRLGELVGDRYRLPVYLYREAATNPRRHDLSVIRRGQFEGLAKKLADLEWEPDFGPLTPHTTAGATVIGARGPLIAYNMVLESDDLQVAKDIAAVVRASSGGLPGIKALGVALESRGLVQVSMNIEDPAATPLEVVSDEVAAEAALCGVQVRETELVGLIPRQAVTPAARRWLSRGDFTSELVLENAIEMSRIGDA
jgi:glutamate formiminotransferase